MFVLKCIDRKEDDWGYFLKDSMMCNGKHGFFYNYVFHTEEEARQHIKTLLNSGYIRKDITENDFSIVEVKQHKGYGSAWYTDEEFEKSIEEEMKAFNVTGHNLFNEYRNDLLKYWKDGHGEMIVLISEMQGFLDCLTMQNLIQEENYMYLIDCFREKLKMIRSK